MLNAAPTVGLAVMVDEIQSAGLLSRMRMLVGVHWFAAVVVVLLTNTPPTAVAVMTVVCVSCSP